jgi:trimethylamine monooxygenase
MFDAQAWYARDVMMGKIQLPDAKGQKEHFEKWRTREGTLKGDEEMITYQGDYIMALISETDYPSFDTEAIKQSFMEWGQNKAQDVMTFRDFSHTSTMTGSKATTHHTLWLEAMDDSMECYLQDKEEAATE